jgi:hypothetical protein
MKFALPFLMAAALISAPVLASDKHGGHEVEAGKYHVELVVNDRKLTVYVRDKADKPIDAKTVKASANVLSGKDKAMIQLVPMGADVLTGDVPFSVSKDAKVIVTLSVAGDKGTQARFSLGQKQDHKGHKH